MSSAAANERIKPGSPPSVEPISMRIRDACKFTGISRSTLYLLIAAGEIDIVKLGKSTLVLTGSLHALLERRRNLPSPDASSERAGTILH